MTLSTTMGFVVVILVEGRRIAELQLFPAEELGALANFDSFSPEG